MAMANENDNRIEDFLDSTLGRWTRLLFWREEISCHLQQLYAKQLEGNENHERAWENAIKDFGDVNDISEKLWQLHKPKRVFIRLLALFVAIAVLYWLAGENIGVFVRWEAMFFLAIPVIIILPFLLFSNRLKLKDINFYAKLSAGLGCSAGAASAILQISDPSRVGPSTALALLCAIYAIVFLNVGKWSLLFFVVINATLAIMVLFVLGDCIPATQVDCIFERTNLIRLAAVSVSGIVAGAARWGLERLPKFLPRIAVGIIMVHLVLMLMSMRSVEEYWHALLLGFLPIIILPFARKFLLYYLASRRRVEIR
jgi:hypothetical protein